MYCNAQKKKERLIGINAIKHKVNLPLICLHIVAHLTMNPSWPLNLRLPKIKTFKRLIKVWLQN